MTNQKYLDILEYPLMLEELSKCAVSEDAKDKALKLYPYDSIYEARRELSLTMGANSLSTGYGYPPIVKTENCSIYLNRASMGGSLSLKELLAIARVLKTMRQTYEYRKEAEGANDLDSLFSCLYVNKDLEKKLSDSIASEDQLDENASPALSEIVKKMRHASLEIRNRLDTMIRSHTYQKYLQEPIVTIRDGRFCVPVKQEYRSEVKGLVHDTSSSGASLFIEPAAVVEMNNEIRILESKKEIEEARIIAALSALCGNVKEEIMRGYSALTELDFSFAKSKLADKMRANPPKLSSEGGTNLKKARHPFIPIDKAVPIDISVGDEYDTLVITGPNTGGKTVAIKTMGLLSLMASSGLMIPASTESKVRVYKKIFADIGDEQSIEQSLSTFSSHMKNIISIVETADDESLVILDELGAGTDPVEGAALAISIIENLRRSGAFVLATTHYPEIKLYALKTEGVQNAGCEFDVASLRPTYRLLTGIPGKSNAFLISEKLGLSQEIIEESKSLIDSGNMRFEDVIGNLEEMRIALEKEKKEAEALRAEALKIRNDAEKEKNQLISELKKQQEREKQSALKAIEDAKSYADLLFEEMEGIKKEKDAENFSRLLNASKAEYNKKMKELEGKADPVRENTSKKKLQRPLQKGDIVFIESLGKEGLVISKPQGDRVQVQAGVIKTTVSINDVTPGEKKKEKKKSEGKATRTGVASSYNKNAMTEVSLLGMDSIEAIMTLDHFIDQAVLMKIPTIRIVHGKGTGVLRAAVAKRLKSHKAIKEFRLGRYGEGEDGVTIATLK